MIYTSFSLNGTWEMTYSEEKYSDSRLPTQYINCKSDYSTNTNPNDVSNNLIEDAVPGYWEDMTEKFRLASFFCKLKVNPEYGLQSYPIAGTAPDMALPNIVGNFFYKRNFWCDTIEGSAVLYFEGVQNSISVWINSVFLGRHEGYSTPFEISIPDGVIINGENIIVLSVSNHPMSGYAGELISGLTNRAANQYTGGITGNVEMRVYKTHLRDIGIFVSDDCSVITVKTDMTQKTDFTWEVCDSNLVIKSGTSNGDFCFDTKSLLYWSPESPKLYTMKISCGDAVLERDFGVRKLVVDGVHFKLNNTPYFLRGICEHCYFPETVHPNHDYAYYCNTINEIKKLGFNFIRFHTYIPEEEYMKAADELGVLLHVECPNNTPISQWKEIVKFCSRHTSVVIYCCGNELLIDETFIEYLNECADIVHADTDALFSPMSAMRGLEYFWVEPEQEKETENIPFKHHPRRIAEVSKFSDMYSSYANGLHSYNLLENVPSKIDEWSIVYNKPRVSHEICINGTYTNLELKDRYKNWRIGKTEMFSSIEKHLEEKGVLKRAPLYFKNSCQWQRRLRKYCFESLRLSNNMAGYDFLGPIDTHWHTFGYDVGMMNEFYELKPGESVRNVLMYNSPTVLLTDLGRKTNFKSGDKLEFSIFASHYGKGDIENAILKVSLSVDGNITEYKTTISNITNGQLYKLDRISFVLPDIQNPVKMSLYATIDGDELFSENEWELYLFPETSETRTDKIVVKDNISKEELYSLIADGKDILLFGGTPFEHLTTSFRIALAGRTSGNLATVINDHPAINDMPHEGFCGWQFAEMLDGGSAICFETDAVPFNPIVEVVSTHKYVIRQAAIFEIKVENSRMFVCGLNLKNEDAGAMWLKNRLISYVEGDDFKPKDAITLSQFKTFIDTKVKKAAANANFAFNTNDKTAVRGKRI